jgi:S1-C subfamily serine protease
LHGGTVEHPWLGISGLAIDPAAEQTYNLPVPTGVLVMTTNPGGPADKAGIHPDSAGSSAKPVGDGDIITEVNGQAVKDVADLTSVISKQSVGSVIHLTVLRHGKQLQIDVTLASWPSK